VNNGRSDNGELISELQVLVDGTSPAATESYEVKDAFTVDDVQFELADYFGRSGAPQAVNVVVDGIPAGVVTRQSLKRAGGNVAESAAAAEVGGGERIQLPGLSARYRLLVFTCPGCDGVAYRIHYDERDLPMCDHGPMELRR
jgi:hypothetical protein